uniref:PDZ domain-containing protein n=1 Tax=Noctiluca scintillans TaxID=2966 RepID=A0A7S1ATJ4_NOCSC|mmetsp:Transcript_59662/g.158772  ORF Transcript_59662/g.158772 Transcript_59662/m.158772 type:complete len:181 (+) Transcript_59662:86-628(+)
MEALQALSCTQQSFCWCSSNTERPVPQDSLGDGLVSDLEASFNEGGSRVALLNLHGAKGSQEDDEAAPVATCMVVGGMSHVPESTDDPRLCDEFTVVLTKTKDMSTLGIKVQQASKKCQVRVSHLTEGLVKDWNDAHPERSVKVGDIIREVNGERGPTSVALTEKLRTHNNLEIVVLRGA